MADQYASGTWKVVAGCAEEFVSRWQAFTGWSLENAPGAKSFVLLRGMEEPVHFMSIGTWADRDSVRAWRGSPEFEKLLGRSRELCDEFRGGDYSLAARPTRSG